MNLSPICLLFVWLGLPLAAQTIQVNKENKTIAINATDSATVIADVAVVSVGFTTYGVAQDATYAACSNTSNQIMKALTDAGIAKQQIASNDQRLALIGNEDKMHFDMGIRFECSQSWKVTTQAGKAADVLNPAIAAGANDSGNIDWQVADDDALEAAAARKALEHARQIAERMAKGLGAKIGSLIYASNQAPNRFPFLGGGLNTESASVVSRPRNLRPLAIVPDKVTRSATVYAVFSIE